MPQQWKKEDSGRLRGGRDKIKFINYLIYQHLELIRYVNTEQRIG